MRRTGPKACRLRLGKEFSRLEPDGVFSFNRQLRMRLRMDLKES